MRADLVSPDPATTTAIGAALAAHLEPGDVVALAGPLGAGKTCLVQGIARGLGVTDRVTSPTFVLVRRHAGRVPLVHCDVYRLEHVGDLHALDDDVLAPDVVTCVEWGDAVVAALPDVRLDVTLGLAGDDEQAPRRLTLEGRGGGWADRWDGLVTALGAAAAGVAAAGPAGAGGAGGADGVAGTDPR
jgi:tRNA threonylcarbamoyladenosine biosynthesis protein TsaE